MARRLASGNGGVSDIGGRGYASGSGVSGGRGYAAGSGACSSAPRAGQHGRGALIVPMEAIGQPALILHSVLDMDSRHMLEIALKHLSCSCGQPILKVHHSSGTAYTNKFYVKRSGCGRYWQPYQIVVADMKRLGQMGYH